MAGSYDENMFNFVRKGQTSYTTFPPAGREPPAWGVVSAPTLASGGCGGVGWFDVRWGIFDCLFVICGSSLLGVHEGV